MSEIHTHLEADTLTKAYLDAAFGAGNYVWYKHDKPLLEQAENPGLATTVRPGRIPSFKYFTHHADCVMQFRLDFLPSASIWPCLRQKDADENITINITASGMLKLYERFAGVNYVRIATDDWALVGGEIVTVILDGATIQIYIDNTLAGSFTSLQALTGQVGYWNNGQNNTSNLVIWPRHWDEASRVVEALNKLSGDTY